jgi:hypothetical protein
MNQLLVQSLVSDGASELEIGQLKKRIDGERGRQIEHCAARASEGELRCLLAAKTADNLAACNPR